METRNERTPEMKKLLASVTVAGLLVAGGTTVAWAAGPDGSGRADGGQPGRAQERGRRGHGVRIALQTAAATIGLAPEDLRREIRGGKTVAQVATEHGIDPASVVNAIVVALTQHIDQKAAEGTIDANRAEQAKQKLPDFANRFVNETKSKGAGERRGYRILKDAVKAAAKEIGVSEEDLKQALKDGKTIAQVAKDHDKSVDDVLDAIVKAATSDIDQAVKDGKLDSKKADEIKKKLPDRVKQLVNRERRNRQGSSGS
jgi:transposase-like protein